MKNYYKKNGEPIVIKEWLLSQILRNKIVFFEEDNEYKLINDICFDDGVMICKFVGNMNDCETIICR